MSRAVLSIGSNLGDRLANLRLAAQALSPYLVRVSPVFVTPPWGPVEQPEFLNAILIASDPEATPSDWLERAHCCEQAAGRTRDVHWGPRTLDVDVIVVDDVLSDDPTLTLPHPQAAQRAFVLLPWLSIEPDATLRDGNGSRSVGELLARLPAAELVTVRELPDVRLWP